MRPPHRSGCWRPVTSLDELHDHIVLGEDGRPRVEIVDRRLWTELVSLTPEETMALAGRLRDRAVEAIAPEVVLVERVRRRRDGQPE